MTKRDWTSVPRADSCPDFNNILAVLSKSKPVRPTLFEFFLNGPLYERLAGDVYERSLQILKHEKAYALGTGNSVPEYVPDENHFAMIRAALDMRGE